MSGYIFATKAHIDNQKKLLSSNMFSTCPHNMVNCRQFEAPLQISTGFAPWQRYCTASSSGRQPNFAALNRGRYQCSAGRPSRWALTHIVVFSVLYAIFTSPARALRLRSIVMSASVCLYVRQDISGITCATFTEFFVHVAYVRGLVLLQHIYDRPHRLYGLEGTFFPTDNAL